MHELAVTESILSIALDHAQQAGAARVSDLHLLIGDLSSIVDDSVQFYWDIICKDTICEGATLHFERIPAQMKCHDCGTIYEMENGLEACPKCKGFRVAILGGDQFRLESIDIDND